MSNFYKSHFFAQQYFEGDEYWRPKVPVPVPVVVGGPGGGGGVWPLWRMKECEDWVEKHKEECSKKWKKSWKKIGPLDPLEALKKKKGISKEEKKNQEIRGLRKKIDQLKADAKAARNRTDELRKLHEKKKAGWKERWHLKREIQRLHQLVLSLNRRIHKLEREKHEAEKQALENFKVMMVPAPAAPPAVPPPPPFQGTIASLEEKKGKLLSALPWALGAGGLYLGTRYLVPDDIKWLKVVGYLGTGALATVAVVKLLDARTVGPETGLSILPVAELK